MDDIVAGQDRPLGTPAMEAVAKAQKEDRDNTELAELRVEGKQLRGSILSALKAAKITTLGQLEDAQQDETLEGIKGLGANSLTQIDEFLAGLPGAFTAPSTTGTHRAVERRSNQ